MSGGNNYGIQLDGNGSLNATTLAFGPGARAETTIRQALPTSSELALLIKDLRVALTNAEAEPAMVATEGAEAVERADRADRLADAAAAATALAEEVERPDVADSRLRQLLHRVSESAGSITAVAQSVTAIRAALGLA
jgi:hypothetical protein